MLSQFTATTSNLEQVLYSLYRTIVSEKRNAWVTG